MNPGRNALLVTPTTRLSNTLAQSLRRAGYFVTVVQSFEAAKDMLSRHPDVLITELKLAEYNGLQLALRGRTLGIPSIVVAEPAFEHEVEVLGAVWLSPESAAGDDLAMTLSRLLQGFAANSAYPWCDGDGEGANAAIRLDLNSGSFSGLLH